MQFVCHSTGWKIKFFFILYILQRYILYISCGEVQPTQGLRGYSYINTYTYRHIHEPEGNGPAIIPVVRQATLSEMALIKYYDALVKRSQVLVFFAANLNVGFFAAHVHVLQN